MNEYTANLMYAYDSKRVVSEISGQRTRVFYNTISKIPTKSKSSIPHLLGVLFSDGCNG